MRADAPAFVMPSWTPPSQPSQLTSALQPAAVVATAARLERCAKVTSSEPEPQPQPQPEPEPKPEPEPEPQPEDWQQDAAELQAAQNLPLDDGGDEPPSPCAGLREPRNILADFKVLHVVGRGGFGKVMQVERRDSGEVFAIKTMRKNHVVKMNDVIGVRTERSVLKRIRHPFIVKLRWAFHTPEKLYLLRGVCTHNLEPYLGGKWGFEYILHGVGTS